MTDPTQMVPAADGPGSDKPPMDRRIVAIIVLAIVIVLLAILLIVASLGDDGTDAADASTTTTSDSSSTTESTTTSTESTTTTTSTTSSSSTSTSTTTTSTTAPPPSTIAPSRCTGQSGPADPEPVAEVFYDAWVVGDVGCAEQVANQDAVDTLFAIDGTGADWTFQGCNTFEDPEPKIDCAYTYEGGAAHFEMQYGAIGGWQIVAVEFVAD